MPDDLERLRRQFENFQRQITSPAAKAQFAEMVRQLEAFFTGQMLPPEAKAQFAEAVRKFSRLRIVDVDQIIQPPPPRTRKTRKLVEKPEDIARGVELAHANGRNSIKAARDLYDQLHPRNPDASRKQQEDWEAARRKFVGRVRQDALFVGFVTQAEFGVLLALGLPLPECVLDLTSRTAASDTSVGVAINLLAGFIKRPIGVGATLRRPKCSKTRERCPPSFVSSWPWGG